MVFFVYDLNLVPQRAVISLLSPYVVMFTFIGGLTRERYQRMDRRSFVFSLITPSHKALQVQTGLECQGSDQKHLLLER